MNSAILITYNKEDVLNEAIGLCDAAGYQIVHTITQNFLKKPKYGISGGILEKLEEITEKLRPDVIVFDEILKPSQNYNLASVLHREILDREALILEIFENRASSSESKLQVKLAQLRYEMARAKEKVRLSRVGEQPGFMGIGQFEVDVYYNDIKHRMQTVRSKLEKAGKQRSAGKTTLFNKLTGETREQSKELFTTLSTTTRKLTINQEVFLMSDTVGFISKLPAYMIDAFRSTLEELIYTDIVILVIDVSDSLFELKKKFASCMRTLNEVGVEQDRIIFALNKSDLVSNYEIQERVKILNLTDNKKWIAVSALAEKNLNELKILIKNIIESQSSPNFGKDIGKESEPYGN
jgi:GTP-binding protein HflX